MKYTATVRMTTEITFEDNGEDELVDQAIDAFGDMHTVSSLLSEGDIEIIGKPEPTTTAEGD